MNDSTAKETGSNHRKYYKDTFGKISAKKRQRITRIATQEFAEKGFKGANVNVISRKAGISIGSMYTYFSSKEHLFLTVVDEGYGILEKILTEADLGKGNIFDRLEQILRIAQKFSREHPELIQLYQDITSEQLSHLSKRLSRKIETVSAVFYRRQLEQAKREGLVDPALDDFVTSYCIDNIILLMQFSYTSDYYRERLRTFIGDGALEEDERIIKGIMAFIRRALGKRAGQTKENPAGKP